MCDCIKQIREQILDRGATSVIVDMADVTTTYTDGTIVRGKTGQRIEVKELKKKKDGTEYHKWRKSFIAHQYCPFCGEEYK